MKDANDLLVAGIHINSIPTVPIEIYCAEQVLDKCSDKAQEYKAIQKYITSVNNELIKADIATILAKRWEQDVEVVRKQLSVRIESEDEKLKDFADIYECFNALDEAKLQEDIGIGFPSIDENAPFRKKWVVLLGAFSFQGKSTTLIEFIIHWIVRLKKRVLFFSLEMSKEDVIEVLIGKVIGVPQHKVRTTVTPEIYRQVAEKISKYLYIIDKNSLSIDEIEEYLQVANNRIFSEPVDIVCVDYFGYLKGVNTTEQEAQTAKRMKEIAKNNNVTLFMLAQFNKGSQYSQDKGKTAKEPMPTDLKGAGEIYFSCDVAYFMWRPVLMQQLSPTDAEPIKYLTKMKIAKIRGGLRKGESHFDLWYNPETGRLSECLS